MPFEKCARGGFHCGWWQQPSKLCTPAACVTDMVKQIFCPCAIWLAWAHCQQKCWQLWLWTEGSFSLSNFFVGTSLQERQTTADHVYLLWEEVNAPRADELGRKDFKWWAVVRNKPASEIRGVCGCVTLALEVYAQAVVRWLDLSALGTSKIFITELHCWNIVPKLDLM